MVLEGKSASELNETRKSEGSGDLTCAAAAVYCQGWTVELRCVESIQGLCPKLGMYALRNREVFVQGEVKITVTGSVTITGARLVAVRTGRRARESRSVEVMIDPILWDVRCSRDSLPERWLGE